MKELSKNRKSLKINSFKLKRTLAKLMKIIEMLIKNKEKALSKGSKKWKRKLQKPH